MEAIRTIIDSESLASIIDIPPALRGRKVEVIVLPLGAVETPESEPIEKKDDASWFTPEQKEQFRQNRLRLEEELKRNPPKMSKEEFSRFLLSGPVADEEEIAMQDEIMEMRRRWTM